MRSINSTFIAAALLLSPILAAPAGTQCSSNAPAAATPSNPAPAAPSARALGLTKGPGAPVGKVLLADKSCTTGANPAPTPPAANPAPAPAAPSARALGLTKGPGAPVAKVLLADKSFTTGANPAPAPASPPAANPVSSRAAGTCTDGGNAATTPSTA